MVCLRFAVIFHKLIYLEAEPREAGFGSPLESIPAIVRRAACFARQVHPIQGILHVGAYGVEFTRCPYQSSGKAVGFRKGQVLKF